MKSFLKSIFGWVSNRIPRPVGTTDSAVKALIIEVCGLAGIPVNPSTQQAVAMMLQGLLRDRAKVSLNRVVVEIHRGMANQALYNAILDARAEEKAKASDLPVQN